MIWIHWINSFGAHYSRVWLATMLRIRELVDEKPDVEYPPTIRMGELLAPDESEDSNDPMIDSLLRMIPQMMSRVEREQWLTYVCTISE